MKKETMEKLNTNEILNTLFTDHQCKFDFNTEIVIKTKLSYK